jgi:hypothetical protein
MENTTGVQPAKIQTVAELRGEQLAFSTIKCQGIKER